MVVKLFFPSILLPISIFSYSQGINTDVSDPKREKIIFGIQAGAGWAYEDEAHLFNTSTGITFDYRFLDKYNIQFAPRYSWLWKWNEHYLTLPVHIRKKFGQRISLFAGPAFTLDIGHFKDLGISAGACYHFSRRSALVISAFVFTLYDYHIDYFYMPVSIAYGYYF
jgi:hypothetical protein